MSENAPGTNGGPPGTNGGGVRPLLIAMAAMISVFAIVNATSDVMEWARDGYDAEPPWHSFLYEYSSAVLWFALVPLFIWLQRRFPFAPPWPKTIAIHALATVPVSLIHVGGMVLIREIGFLLAYGQTRTYDFLGDAPAMTLLYEWRKDVLSYAMFSGFIWAWDRFRRTPAPGPVPETLARIEIRDGARTTYLPAIDAYWIEAAGNYVEVHTAGQTHLVRGTLAGFESKLQGAGFVRVHRSRLVNTRRIRTLAGTEAGDFTITLDDGRIVGGSRRYRAGVAPSSTP